VTDARRQAKANVHWQIEQIPHLRTYGISKESKKNDVPCQMKNSAVQPHISEQTAQLSAVQNKSPHGCLKCFLGGQSTVDLPEERRYLHDEYYNQ
jgi:hypothetical protein